MVIPAQRKTKLQEYVRALLQREPAGAVAVFDIGTKAARMLVGPRRVPEGPWAAGDFFNDAFVANLGIDLAPGATLPFEGHAAFAEVVTFVRDYAGVLAGEGVHAADVRAVGTAVFRWLANRDDALRYFAAQTGVRLTVLPPEEESQLSLSALMATYRFGLPRDLAPFDALVLLDQGGGSLEISYATPGREAQAFESFDRLGTVYLRDRFTSESGDLTARLANLRTEIAGRVQEWPGLPGLAGLRLMAYGMGTAVAGCLPRKQNFFLHNSVVTREQMDACHAEAVAAYGGPDGQTDSALTVLFGLPVFQALMDRLGVSELRFAGYGLRYGVYLRLYREGAPLASL